MGNHLDGPAKEKSKSDVEDKRKSSRRKHMSTEEAEKPSDVIPTKLRGNYYSRLGIARSGEEGRLFGNSLVQDASGSMVN